MYIFFFCVLFFPWGFSFTDTEDSQDSRGREGAIFLFHSATSIISQTFRHLLATSHVRWHIFIRTACIYQTATRLDLPLYRITIWMIDDVTLVFFFCVSDDLILAFLWDGKPVDSNSHWLSPLYYKRTD